MGYRLHYAKKYRVSYGGGYFNWQAEEFEKMVNNELPTSWSNEEFSTSDSYEIYPKELKAYIRKLRKDEKSESLYFKDYTKKEEADSLQEILNNYDTNNDYIKLEWF